MTTNALAKQEGPTTTAASPGLTELVAEASGLVSPPGVCLQVFELLQTGAASATDFGDVIARDPSLTARLLGIVNSAFYGLRSRIDTVSRAVTVIGIDDMYNLVVAASAVNTFSRIPVSLLNMDSFWRHGVYSALLSRLIARRCNVLHTERLFVAGLLHDIGTLVLLNRLPGVMKEMLLVSGGDEQLLHAAELDTLGFSHAEVGERLLELWNIPEGLRLAVGRHHCPDLDDPACREAVIVHLADALASHSEIGALLEDPIADLSGTRACWEALGMSGDETEIEEILAEATAQFTETANALMS